MNYSTTIEEHMKFLYQSLNEKDRRRYAAVEAEKLGHGGVESISGLLGCDAKTIRRGRAELDDPPQLEPDRIRKKGGGAKLRLKSCRNSKTTFRP